MRLLLDENVSPLLVSLLAKPFPDSTHVHEVDLGSAPDMAVWDYARENDYTILSKDSDFTALSLQRGHPPKVVWIRRGNCSTEDIRAMIQENEQLLLEFQASAETGVLVIS